MEVLPQLGERVARARKIRGLSQRDLARQSGVSYSMIRQIEQGTADASLSTVRKLATALRLPTTALVGSRGDATDKPLSAPDEAIWAPTWRAIHGRHAQPADDPTLSSVELGLADLKPLLAANRYDDVAAYLPALLRDAEALNGAGRGIHARVLNTTAWTLVQTRQFTMAHAALHQAVDLAVDHLDAAAAVNTLVWLHLRKGELADARDLAIRWADRIEPRLSKATERELTLWGRLLLGISNAAIRDNRPGEADDAIRLAGSAATAIGREVESDSSTTRTFGPVTVGMIRAENHMVLEQPDRVLKIAERITPGMGMLHPKSASRNRHLLDVASALTMTRRVSEAVAVLSDLHAHSPQWLRNQRYAGDIVTRVIARRRTLPDEVRTLAEAVGVAL